ncbi:MAG TPA: response regulator [Acidisoma sp.]|uniref:response regulator transcription factor n=1 Tax=Acidisoma sp. TaxID=1872115 RepID=UPI002C81F30E|nr:response regulator [Acidisoma sp.]HTI03376.1 response regulator [Acidisoma sp.]
MDVVQTVHVVDDDEGVRLSIEFLLKSEGLAPVTYASASDLLSTSLQPAGCVLTDFHMPGMDGLELQSRLADRGVRLPVIVMTGFADVPAAVRAMKAGAVDFLEKPFAEDQLLHAVRRALAENRQALGALRAAQRASQLIATLTPRESEVLHLLAEGHSNKEMARVLGTSPRTIDVHRARVLQKLGVETLPDLVRLVLAARPPEQGSGDFEPSDGPGRTSRGRMT